MSHFYSSIQGSRGEATRCGTKSSGMIGHIRGWNLGCEVYMYVDEDGKDRCQVYLTSGSNGRYSSKCLGDFTEEDLKGDTKDR